MEKQYRHESLEASELTLAYILDLIREGVWDWDARSGRVDRSPGWYRMLGYEVGCFKKDVLAWENIIHPDDYARVTASFEAYIRGRTEQYLVEYRCRCSDGRYLWIEDIGKIVERSSKGEALRVIGAHYDIDELKRAREKLERQQALLQQEDVDLEKLVEARTAELAVLNEHLSAQLESISKIACFDRLTSVYNRYMFEEFLQKELNRARRYGRPMSLIMVDVDYFKQINDDFGHKTGDSVLAQVAATLKRHVRDSDIVARWGGEEFVIILPDMTKKNALVLADKLRETIAGCAYGNGITLTCSFGVTAFREGDTVDTVFNRIDKALYRAKEFERNNVQSE